MVLALGIALIFELPKLFPLRSLAFWLVAPLYPVAPFAMFLALNNSPDRLLLAIMFIMVFTCDTGAYATGSLIGKTKLAPTISPKKTWEGVFGGCILAYIALCIWMTLMNKPITFAPTAALTLAVCALAITGDLFESWLKRRVKIKDTSTLLPGHGGVLDRFDACMFAVVLFYLLRSPLSKLLL